MSNESSNPAAPYGGTGPAAATRKPVTLHRLRALRDSGEKVAMLTAYDASSAALLDAAGVDCLLVGDSLGMVVQGHASTLPVTLEQMAYHTACVARANRSAWLVADLPFGSYQESTEQAVRSATVLMQAGAQMVKLEGGGWTAPLVEALAARISADFPGITIGIGAGAQTHGQVLVLQDMLDISNGPKPRFVRNFMQGAPSIAAAVETYVRDVKSGAFPDEARHGYLA
jgi:ketopantoate hydroxymethyltransferase